jgi:hypothetical protein
MRLKVRKIFKVVFNLLSARGSDEETMPLVEDNKKIVEQKQIKYTRWFTISIWCSGKLKYKVADLESMKILELLDLW